jgi:hypothetical protein
MIKLDDAALTAIRVRVSCLPDRQPSVDDKSQIQALEHTRPVHHLVPERPATCTHDYVRHRTTTLFATLRACLTDRCNRALLSAGGADVEASRDRNLQMI